MTTDPKPQHGDMRVAEYRDGNDHRYWLVEVFSWRLAKTPCSWMPADRTYMFNERPINQEFTTRKKAEKAISRWEDAQRSEMRERVEVGND